MTAQALPSLVGIRPARRDGTHDLDPLMIGAAIKACGKYDYNVLDFDPSLVVVEVLKADPARAAHWTVRCAAEPRRCRSSFRAVERPIGNVCCGAPARITETHAGWRWVADAVWTMARAVERGATKDDHRNLWGRFPDACLLGKALREILKLHCPDALPVGIRVYHEEEQPAAPDRAPAPAPAREPARLSVLNGGAPAAPRLTKRQAQATTALAAHLAGNPVTTIDGKEDERAKEEAEQDAAARFEAGLKADTRAPVRDPDWLEDDSITGDSSVVDTDEKPHAVSTVLSAPTRAEGPNGAPALQTCGSAAPALAEVPGGAAVPSVPPLTLNVAAGGDPLPLSPSPPAAAPTRVESCPICSADLSDEPIPGGGRTIKVRLCCRGCDRTVCLDCARGTPQRLRCVDCHEAENPASPLRNLAEAVATIGGGCLTCGDDPCSCPEVPVLADRGAIAARDAETVSPESEGARVLSEQARAEKDHRKRPRHRWVDHKCAKCGEVDPGPKGKAPPCPGRKEVA